MKMYVHRIIVTVTTPDANPASVAATIDAGLSNGVSTHPKGKLYATDSLAAANEPKAFEIPDEPYNGEPDTLAEADEHDAWMNNHVYPLFSR